MDIFLSLLPQMILLYFVIFLGFIATRYLELSRDGISKLSIYILVPMVMFYGTMKTDLSIAIIFIPLIIFIVSTANCFLSLKVCNRFLDNKPSANILGLSAGTGNSGYVGIPIAFMLFEENVIGLYIISILGMTLFQNSIGFYVAARGKRTAQESFMQVLKLPVLYAFIFALILKFSGIEKTPEFMIPFLDNIKGCYVTIGMMIIGASLAKAEDFKINLKFTFFAFLVRFIFWPIIALTVYYIDQVTLGIFNEDIFKCLILMAIVPIAADTVAIANILKSNPEEMAGAIVISCIFALFYVPFMAALFLAG